MPEFSDGDLRIPKILFYMLFICNSFPFLNYPIDHYMVNCWSLLSFVNIHQKCKTIDYENKTDIAKYTANKYYRINIHYHFWLKRCPLSSKFYVGVMIEFFFFIEYLLNAYKCVVLISEFQDYI